jgi:thymidylate synthase ThyX
MANQFSPEQEQALSTFFTNLDQDVFGLKLPQEVAGALFSRYSRSSKGLRQIFLEEFIGQFGVYSPASQPEIAEEQDAVALKKAREFYDRVLIGYGDDSVAQLGGAHIACENISNVAANLLEDSRIGIAPLEKSTRYVRFDKKDANNEYPIFKEPRIMASRHAGEYLRVMNLMFKAYASQLDPMIEFVKKSRPISEMEFKHPKTGEPLSFNEFQKDEGLSRWAESAYRSTVRAQACDILRGYLPAATKTNVGLFGVGQAFEYLLTKLYSGPLQEARDLAAEIHRELNRLIPSFVKRAQASPYLVEAQAAIRMASQQKLAKTSIEKTEVVSLVDYDREAEEKILAAMFYPNSRHSLIQLRRVIREMTPSEREGILSEQLRRRKTRRDKPGRALEQVYYTFDILGNLGLYRDLRRHRILTQERQDFSVVHGYDTPEEIIKAGYQADFDRVMQEADRLYETIERDLPHEAQYVVPFAYRIRWYMKLNLREAVHIGELRTMPQGHPDYRIIVQEMWRKIQEVHPMLGACARFIDWKTYRLGRLQSEMRTEFKRAKLEKNEV